MRRMHFVQCEHILQGLVLFELLEEELFQQIGVWSFALRHDDPLKLVDKGIEAVV